jgi:hypothetical protein
MDQKKSSKNGRKGSDKRRLPPLKLTYRYLKPKNEEELKKQIRKVEKAYDILFNAVLEKQKNEGKLIME